ncbi:hypothetical protein RF11_07087 [Thelohanellus kitauei]|uniref:Uncharacterized protein n=1 Tax=Thelohanellus kitauei TaxID=669202 RepID=A0A0C2MCZ6_THEKT|nr:hypothetical protein RF11_07087 [Thelohanellus kitauei]
MGRKCLLTFSDYSKIFECPDLRGTDCYCFQELTKINMPGIIDSYNPVHAHGILTYLRERSRQSLKELSKGCKSKNRNFNPEVCQDELGQYIKFIADSRQRLQEHGFDEAACKDILKYS